MGRGSKERVWVERDAALSWKVEFLQCLQNALISRQALAAGKGAVGIYGLADDEISQGCEGFVGPLGYKEGKVRPGEVAGLQIYLARERWSSAEVGGEAIKIAERLAPALSQITCCPMKGCALILLDELVVVDKEFWARIGETVQTALLGEGGVFYPIPHDFRGWSFRGIESRVRETASLLVDALADRVPLYQNEGCLERWWWQLDVLGRVETEGHLSVWTNLIYRSPFTGDAVYRWPLAYKNLEKWVASIGPVYQYLLEKGIIAGELV